MPRIAPWDKRATVTVKAFKTGKICWVDAKLYNDAGEFVCTGGHHVPGYTGVHAQKSTWGARHFSWVGPHSPPCEFRSNDTERGLREAYIVYVSRR